MADDNDNPSFLRAVAQQISNIGSGGSGVSARSRLRIDSSELQKLNKELTNIKDTLLAISKVLPNVTKNINSLGKANLGKLSQSAGPVGAGGSTNANVPTSLQPAVGGPAANPPSGGGPPTGGPPSGGGPYDWQKESGGAGSGKLGVGSVAAALVSKFGPMVVGTMDQRIDRGANYALSADRLSMVYQQMTGLSQTQVQDKYRQPLTNYRLGAGGINTLLSLQAETGINAARQAPSVEALRAISGYTLGTGDVANMISSMARPETVNKMFMMTGQSLYGFGGRQRPTMDVIKSIVNTNGLNKKDVVDSAFQPGSVTRERLRMAGLPEDTITTVLQYARENITFKEKGGKGMYDPSRKEDRKKMGVEDNYASQFEETTRVREKREEQFYSRQADNLADMEKATQNVTKALGKLEDQLSGMIGARAKTRGYQKAGGSILKTIGGIATVLGGAALIAGTGGAAAPVVLGMSASTLLGVGTAATVGGKMLGDGEFDKGTGSNPKPTTGSSNAPKNTASSSAKRTSLTSGKYRGLKPKFAERLYAMLKDNSKVHINVGWRSSKTQENLFLSRYKRTDSKTDLYWDGSYWDHVRGPAAAPPGRSMHEIGLAADLTGDLDWVQKNAHKYGLKTFAKVNNEPWHVQPDELPNSRREYERRGAPWGTDPNAQPSDDDARPPQDDGLDKNTSPDNPNAEDNNGVNALNKKTTKQARSRTGSNVLSTYAGQSISEVLKQRQTQASSYSQNAVIEGDGSFYSGVSREPAEPPVLSAVGATSTRSPVYEKGQPNVGSNVFNINPTINLYGNGGNGFGMDDLKKISREVGRLLEEEVRRKTARRN